MILKIALNSVVRGAASWVSLIVTAVVLSVVLTLNIALIAAGVATEGEAQQAYVAMGSVALGFSLLTGLASFILVVGICVRLQRRDVALWQLVGVLPKTAYLIMLTEIVLVSAVSAVVGVLISTLVWPSYTNFVSTSGLPYSDVLHGAIPTPALVIGVATTAAVSVLAGLRSSRKTVQGNLVEGVQNGAVFEEKPKSYPWRIFNLALGVALLIGVGAIYNAISKADEISDPQALGDFLTVYPGMGLLLCLVFAMAGGPVVRLLVRLIQLIPFGGVAKFLASREASARPRLTRALVMPITLAAAAVGVMVAWVEKLTAVLLAEAGSADSVSAPPEQMALLLGGPVISACVSAAAIVFATMANRMQDNALLMISGSVLRTVYAKVLIEALIYIVVAFGCSYLIVTLNEFAMVAALSSGPIPSVEFSWPGLESAAVVAFGGVLTLAMLLIITTAGLRKKALTVVLEGN